MCFDSQARHALTLAEAASECDGGSSAYRSSFARGARRHLSDRRSGSRDVRTPCYGLASCSPARSSHRHAKEVKQSASAPTPYTSPNQQVQSQRQVQGQPCVADQRQQVGVQYPQAQNRQQVQLRSPLPQAQHPQGQNFAFSRQPPSSQVAQQAQVALSHLEAWRDRGAADALQAYVLRFSFLDRAGVTLPSDSEKTPRCRIAARSVPVRSTSPISL